MQAQMQTLIGLGHGCKDAGGITDITDKDAEDADIFLTW